MKEDSIKILQGNFQNTCLYYIQSFKKNVCQNESFKCVFKPGQKYLMLHCNEVTQKPTPQTSHCLVSLTVRSSVGMSLDSKEQLFLSHHKSCWRFCKVLSLYLTHSSGFTARSVMQACSDTLTPLFICLYVYACMHIWVAVAGWTLSVCRFACTRAGPCWHLQWALI